MKKRLVFIQHGDYAEAYDRFVQGFDETYYAQRFSVDVVGDMLQYCEAVSVVCLGVHRYDRMLSNGVRAIGVSRNNESAGGTAGVIDWLMELKPTHVIPRTPRLDVLSWARSSHVRLLPMLADSFSSSIWSRIKNRRLRELMNASTLDWIGNHNINASQSLARIGVDPNKIIPWDWPIASDTPASVKREPQHQDSGPRLIFVGVHSEAKGLSDVIHAVALLRRKGCRVRQTCIGAGDRESFARLAGTLGIEEAVEFRGLQPRSAVIEAMVSHDVVVIPSRREYPEGMPFTIYDALLSRTPIVASDHPMFADKLVDGESAIVYRAGNPSALARSVERLLADRSMYHRLSANSEAALQRLVWPTKWHEVVARWLRGRSADKAWLSRRTLSGIERGSFPS